MTALPMAWNHYLTLSSGNFLTGAVSFIYLVLCLSAMLVRCLSKRLDALYVLFYLLILFIWPFTINDRFLHPVAFLLMVQPILYVITQFGESNGQRYGIFAILTMLTATAIWADIDIWRKREAAVRDMPQIANAYHYYHQPGKGVTQVKGYSSQQVIIRESAKLVGKEEIVATAKAPFFALLSDRHAVNAYSRRGLGYFACDLYQKNATWLYLSGVTTYSSPEGLALFDKVKFLSEQQFFFRDDDKQLAGIMLKLDRTKLANETRRFKQECRKASS